jgi:hypothetical protein
MTVTSEEFNTTFKVWNDLWLDLTLLKQCDLNEYQMGLVEKLDGHLADCINQYFPDKKQGVEPCASGIVL